MSIRALQRVYALPKRGIHLRPLPRFVLVTLANYVNEEEGGIAWPSINTLAEQTGYSRAAICEALIELEEAGLITRTRRARDNGSLRSTEYRIMIGLAADAEVLPDARVIQEPDGGVVQEVDYLVQGADYPSPGGGPLDLVVRSGSKNQKPKSKSKPKTLVGNSDNGALAITPHSAQPRRVSRHEAWQEAWNEHCGPLPRVNTINAQRQRAIARTIKDYPDEPTALAAFILAAQQVARDSFWIERGYGIDNLLRSGRVVEKAEKAIAPGANLSPADRAYAVRLAQIRKAVDSIPEREEP